MDSTRTAGGLPIRKTNVQAVSIRTDTIILILNTRQHRKLSSANTAAIPIFMMSERIPGKTGADQALPKKQKDPIDMEEKEMNTDKAVSYTHLTLPTSD